MYHTVLVRQGLQRLDGALQLHLACTVSWRLCNDVHVYKLFYSLFLIIIFIKKTRQHKNSNSYNIKTKKNGNHS